VALIGHGGVESFAREEHFGGLRLFSVGYLRSWRSERRKGNLKESQKCLDLVTASALSFDVGRTLANVGLRMGLQS
jgi:hypothetical protein